MKIKFLTFNIIVIMSWFSLAQDRKKDTIDDQVVNVIKPYTPTISDAFKIKNVPRLDDSTTIEKKPVKYNIFSIPVASTFTPAKGKAANVDKAKPVKLYDNYASLGAGNYTTILGEVYLNHSLNNSENVGGYFSHHSSQGGIDDILLNDDDFSKTSLNAYYAQKLDDFSWKLTGGFDFQTYNWYGVPQNAYSQTQIDGISPGHNFTSFYVDGRLNFENSIINDGSVLFRRFSDDEDSGENRFVAKTSFDFNIQDYNINTAFYIDYLKGDFNRNSLTTDAINYGNFTLGIAPSYQLIKDDLTVDLGLKLVYLNDTENSDNNFYIYPNIEASYRLVNDILIAFGGVKGELIQNTYHNFADENPFVSPTLNVVPTDNQYKGFLGIKGKLSNNVSYNIKGDYASEKNKALYKANNAQITPTESYQFGNSFGIVYDDLRTLSIAGELNFNVNRNFTLGIKGAYFNYDTDNQQEAWNLPDITGSIFLDVQISEQWFAGASTFYTGERKDELLVERVGSTEIRAITLDSYFDANAHVGYKYTDQLAFFIKANNIANQDYERWANYPVQGLQILGGATYQFDF